MSNVTRVFQDHYSKSFIEYGATNQGVGWKNSEHATRRHEIFYEETIQRALIQSDGRKDEVYSVLDVGCGYGAYLNFIKSRQVDVDYTGIDLVPEMIHFAQAAHPKSNFISGDFMAYGFAADSSDFVITNGMFTQRLDLSQEMMDQFFISSIRKMYSVARVGIGFNLLTTEVDYEKDGNFYRSPGETLQDALKLGSRVNLRHDTDFFEYFVFIFK